MFENYLDLQKLWNVLQPRGERLSTIHRCKDRTWWENLSQNTKDELLALGDRYLKEDYPMLYVSSFRRVLKGEPYQIYDLDLFKRMNMISAMAIAECISNNDVYMDKIIDGIWLVCEESTWCVPSHYNGLHPMPTMPDVDNPWIDIHGSRRAATLAMVAYLLEDKLNAVSPVIMQRIRRELDIRMVRPFLQREDFWWMGINSTFMNNWSVWTTTNILLIMMLLYDDPQTVALGMYRSIWIIDRYLQQLPQDGGCDEGCTYWSMAGGKLLEILLILSESTNGAIDVFNNELIKAIGLYPLYVHIQDDLFVNFADCALHASPSPIRIYLYGLMTHNEELKNFGAAFSKYCSRMKPDNGELYMFLQELSVTYDTNASFNHPLNEHREFKELQLYTWRKGSWFAAIKGGTNGESHNHNDLGHFILYRYGRPQIVDPGTATYTSKTFSPQRYTLWHIRANAHNIPLIGGYEQHDGKNYFARVVAKDSDSVTYQLANAYPADASVVSYTRHFMINEDSILLKDVIQQEAEQEVCWIFMLANAPQWDAQESCIICPDFKMQCPTGIHYAVEHIAVDDETARKSYENLWRVRLTAAPCKEITATFTIR